MSDLAARLDQATAAQGGITPRMVSCNWLASGVPNSNPDGGGGPAARPIPDDTAATGEAHDSIRLAWEFSPPLELQSSQRRAEVEGAVSSTAPDPADLERATATWPGHPLLRTLLRPKYRLQIWYLGYTHLLQLVDYGLPGHPYVLSDHGLFSAGIIHSVAPDAVIELAEVLHPYGVGTLETRAVGLAHLAARATAVPLVVNCSWVLNLPRSNQQATAAQDHPIYHVLDPDTLRRMSLPLHCERRRSPCCDSCDLCCSG